MEKLRNISVFLSLILTVAVIVSYGVSVMKFAFSMHFSFPWILILAWIASVTISFILILIVFKNKEGPKKAAH